VGDHSFSGTIGDVPVSLGRIPGDTLILIIPNVGEGPAELKVTMGRQVRTWDLQLSKWPNLTDRGIFFDNFLKSALELQKEIQEVDGTEMENVRDFWLAMVGGLNKTMAVPFALDNDFEIKNYFNQMDREIELILASDIDLEKSSDSRGPIGNA
jgi:hypothetical protein